MPNHPTWKLKHPRATFEMLGLIPEFLSLDDPRPAKAQLDLAYAHGGGWQDFQGSKMEPSGIRYPGDPPCQLIAETKLRNEVVRIYEHAWVAIVQPDGSYAVSRMD